GAVGKVALDILAERDFPMESLRLCASPRSIGKKINYKGQDIVVEEANAKLFSECDIAFISATTEISRELAPVAVENGCVVIDDSSAFRMEPDVPLVIPEVNGADVEGHKGILAIPNCSTTQMVMALWPLHQANAIKRVVVDTYQSVSGTGAAAMAELDQQAGDILAGKPIKTEQYPYQIAFNLLPQIDSFMEDGYTKEEWKMLNETRKIMHAPEIALSATCVRVPVPICHSESVNVEFERPMPAEEARKLLAGFPGVVVVDDTANGKYPMPIDGAGRDEVFVGRIRKDSSHPNGLVMWVVSDNLRKGAATNAIQIAEEVVKRGAWLRERV
ncbi:MAG: aspartate-semialdehyde dehydrogenase, partial [Dehalococcoidia bacterium]